jgi:VWFA-related protein
MKSLVAIGAFLLGTVPIWGQAPNMPGLPTPPPFTLQVNTRVVLTDVTVTDPQGNPVTGLTASDFQVFDNGKLQKLSSFEPHEQRRAVARPALDREQFNNAYVLHPPPQVNVLLFDTTTIEIVDQMYLFQQMKQFVDNLPAGEPVAIFARSGPMTLQLAAFTDDHATLTSAISKAIPQLQSPGVWMLNDIETLKQVADHLTQIPGRKNLLWFTSGSNLVLGADPMGISMDPGLRRAVYDLLESERIAIYPIDARGLVVYPEQGMKWQQMQMRQDAEATGGVALMNTNGLALAAQHILSTDGNYYTLSYTPNNLKNNNKWHRVQVKLNGQDYQLSYRRGYFDDGTRGPNQTLAAVAPRKVLRAGGDTADVVGNKEKPIAFSVKILPVVGAAQPSPTDTPLKKGERRYVLEYDVSAREVFPAKMQGDVGTDELGTAVLVYDRNGELLSRKMLKWSLGVDERRAREASNPKLRFTQTVNLPKGQNYLYVGLWDMTSKRMGTVNANVEVEKP